MQTLNLQVPTMRPYGQRVGNLTRFGEVWLNMDEITIVDFEPADGCACEISLRGHGGEVAFHFNSEDAECLKAYLTGFESIQKQVDEAQPVSANRVAF